MSMPYSIIFTIGRMNPPTPGHFDLIENLFIHALKHHLRHIHIILSSKTDTCKNPLDPEYKREFLFAYAIPYIKEKLINTELYIDKDIESMEVDILLTHEHNRTWSNDIYSTVSHLLTPLKGKKNKALFITGPESTFSFDNRVDILRVPRKNSISGTIVRTLAFQSYKLFTSVYLPYDIADEDLEFLYDRIVQLEPPSESNISAMDTYMNSRRHLLRM
jgi:hypothetical protein